MDNRALGVPFFLRHTVCVAINRGIKALVRIRVCLQRRVVDGRVDVACIQSISLAIEIYYSSVSASNIS